MHDFFQKQVLTNGPWSGADALGWSWVGLYVCSREGNEPGDALTVTYRELLQKVCRFANVLKSQGTFTADPSVDPIYR